MKFLLLLAVTLAVCSMALAAESIGFYKDPAYPGKCVYKTLILSPGEEGRLPDTCGRLICGENSFGTVHTCGVYGTSDNCRFTEYVNRDGPYPECCERKLVCDSGKNCEINSIA